MDNGRLSGKVAVVTGAARGIGLAITRAFDAEGADVIATDIDAEAGRSAAAASGIAFEPLDVREDGQWASVIGAVMQERDRLDVLVNCAGIAGLAEHPGPHDPEHISLDSWRAVHATNLEGVMLGCKHALAAMRRTTTGSIINIGSRSGLVGVPAACAYASSKAAVRNHTKSVALYAASQGWTVRCNVIQPAAILTPMWDAMLGKPGPGRDAAIAEIASSAPLRRFGTAEEVAALAVYLASDESAYATGTEFNLDGGMLAGEGAPPTDAD